MFYFRTNDSETVYGVLIDINSSSVGIAITASNPGKETPSIIFSHRNTMRVTTHDKDKAENVRCIREALFSASLIVSQEGMQSMLSKDASARITKMYVTCGAPWAYTVARDVYYQNDEAFKVTPTLIDDLVTSAESEILEEIERDSEISEHGFTIVERATVDITINDYPVHNPIKLKGSTLGLSHVAGLIPEDILSAINEIKDKLFSETTLHMHTYMLVMYCVLRDLFPKVNSFCIVNITGEATEFAVVENNVLVSNTSFPAGNNTFIRMVMEKTKKPASDIQSFMQTHGDDAHLDDFDLTDHKDTYVTQVSDAFTHILERQKLPKDVVITTLAGYNAFFTPLIEAAFTKATTKKPHLLTIKDSVITSVSNETNSDTFIALSARFFHKLHGCIGLETDK